MHPTTSVQSCLYVDDIMASADADKKKELDQFVKRVYVQLRFLVRILGEPTKFLGMELTYMREQGICCVSQQLYVEKLARVFLKEQDTQYPAYPTTPMEVNAFDRLEKAESEPNFEGPYRSIVGGLLYISVCTRMDIGFALSILTQNLANPKPTHFLMAKRVLFYLVGTKSFGLVLGGEKLTTLIAFSDASFANDKIDRRSMGGYVVFVGNSPISWAIKKHRGVQAVSSTESEIVQVTEATKELLWLQPLLIELGFPEIDWDTALHTDNEPAMHILLNNPTHSNRTKHMDIRIKFCGEVLAKRQKIALKYVPTKFNFADIFTKPLATVRFRELRGILVQNLEGIVNNSSFLRRTFAVLKDFMTNPFSR